MQLYLFTNLLSLAAVVVGWPAVDAFFGKRRAFDVFLGVFMVYCTLVSVRTRFVTKGWPSDASLDYGIIVTDSRNQYCGGFAIMSLFVGKSFVKRVLMKRQFALHSVPLELWRVDPADAARRETKKDSRQGPQKTTPRRKSRKSETSSRAPRKSNPLIKSAWEQTSTERGCENSGENGDTETTPAGGAAGGATPRSSARLAGGKRGRARGSPRHSVSEGSSVLQRGVSEVVPF